MIILRGILVVTWLTVVAVHSLLGLPYHVLYSTLVGRDNEGSICYCVPVVLDYQMCRRRRSRLHLHCEWENV